MNRRSRVPEAVVWLSSDLEDEQVAALLIDCGCSTAQAWRLVALVPMAFARAVFAPAGVQFCGYYQVVEGGVLKRRRRDLGLDPVYQEALGYAQRMAVTRRLVALYPIVRRSAEYAAIQKLHRHGHPFVKIRLTEPGLVPAT